MCSPIIDLKRHYAAAITHRRFSQALPAPRTSVRYAKDPIPLLRPVMTATFASNLAIAHPFESPGYAEQLPSLIAFGLVTA
jgi:hypothetical protein